MWLKHDDSVYDHPKVLAMGDALFGRLVRTQAWCARHKMGGDIPAALLGSLPLSRKDVTRLVEIGALDEGMVFHDGAGWHCHDWEDYNPTPDQAREYESRARDRRESARERKRRERSRKRDGVTPSVTRDVTPVSRDGHSKSSRDPVPSPSPPQGGGRDGGGRDNTSGPVGSAGGGQPPGPAGRGNGVAPMTPEEWRIAEEAEQAAAREEMRAAFARSSDPGLRQFGEALLGGGGSG